MTETKKHSFERKHSSERKHPDGRREIYDLEADREEVYESEERKGAD